MLHLVFHSFQNALMITVFVVSMMLILEFLNVVSRGAWLGKLQQTSTGQVILGAFLGALPGCLGSYTVVSMYMHRIVRIGAVMATMMATTGDEAFVMVALFPQRALVLTLMLLGLGVVSGWLTDRLWPTGYECAACTGGFDVHEEVNPFTLSPARIWRQLNSGDMIRPLLLVVISGFVVLLAAAHDEHGFGWEKYTLMGVGVVTLVLILAADEHFLIHHLWRHVILRHVAKIFAWIFATLLVLQLVQHLHWQDAMASSPAALILAGAIVGLIPQSGPHLLFVNMFAQGLAPFSVLIANSIVQDGHACLPLLAQSRRDFLLVKGIKLVVGLALGFLAYFLGY